MGSPTASADPITLISANVAVTDGGVLNLQDDVTINGGLLTRDGTSDLNLAAGKKLTAVNNAQIRFTEPYLIANGTTFEITDGSTLSSDVFIAVGLESSGTLIVDNATVETGSAVLTNAPWADGVANADVTIRNNATANFGSHISLVGSGPPGRNGIIRVQSGADMTVHNFRIANNSSGDGTVLVDGVGSTLIQDAAALLTIGTSSSNTAILDLTNQGEFTTGSGPVTINPTGTVNIDTGGRFNANGDMNVNGTVNLMDGTMDAGLIAVNPGGAFNFTGGTLHVDTFDGDLNNQGGTLSPGNSPGITEVTGDYTQTAAGTLAIEAAGRGCPGVPDGHDLLDVTGNADLAGTLQVDLIDGFFPTLGNTFTIVEAGEITGWFDTFTGDVFNFESNMGLAPLLIPGATVNDPDMIVLTAATPGDANLDGRVDAGDLNELALNWQTGDRGWREADFTGDGFVDAADLNLLAINWQFGVVQPTLVAFDDAFSHALAAAVPEPGTMGLLTIGGLAMIRRRDTYRSIL